MTKQEILKRLNLEKSPVTNYLFIMAEEGGCINIEACYKKLAMTFLSEKKYHLYPAEDNNILKRMQPLEEIFKEHSCDGLVLKHGMSLLCIMSLKHHMNKTTSDKLFNKFNPINNGLNYGQEYIYFSNEYNKVSIPVLDNYISKEDLVSSRAFWK